MFDTIYGLNLVGADGQFQAKTEGQGGYGMYPAALGQAFSDSFHRDRSPSQTELLGHLVGTAYRCANLNSNLLASSRLRLYLKTAKGQPKAKFVAGWEATGRKVTRPVPIRRVKRLEHAGATGKSALLDAVEDGDGDIEEVTEHPILDLLRQPEDALTDGGLVAYDHRWVTQCLLEVLGRAYWLIVSRDKFGQPKRLVVLRSHRVREVPDETGKKWIDHFEYGTAKIDPKDVIRFAIPDPSNPHLGFLPPMRAAIDKVRLSRGGDAFTNALLQNGGYPAGIWSPKGDSEGTGIGPAEARRMASSFRSSFATAGAGGLMVSESPGTLQPLQFKPAEIVDVKRARELVGEIADCFDVPRTKLFRDTSNRASGHSGDADHARDAGLARCSRFEETINAQLVPLFDDTGRLFLAFDSPVPEDRLAALEETRTGGQLGIATINEGRASMGIEPDEGPLGDCRILPKGSLIVDEKGKVIDLGAAADGGDGQRQPKPDPAKKPKKSAAKALRRLERKVESLLNEANTALAAAAPKMPAVRSPEADPGSEVLPAVRDELQRPDSGPTSGGGNDAIDRAKVKSALIAARYSEAEAEKLTAAKAHHQPAQL